MNDGAAGEGKYSTRRHCSHNTVTWSILSKRYCYCLAWYFYSATYVCIMPTGTGSSRQVVVVSYVDVAEQTKCTVQLSSVCKSNFNIRPMVANKK